MVNPRDFNDKFESYATSDPTLKFMLRDGLLSFEKLDTQLGLREAAFRIVLRKTIESIANGILRKR
jgi:hypothetical protein